MFVLGGIIYIEESFAYIPYLFLDCKMCFSLDTIKVHSMFFKENKPTIHEDTMRHTHTHTAFLEKIKAWKLGFLLQASGELQAIDVTKSKINVQAKRHKSSAVKGGEP